MSESMVGGAIGKILDAIENGEFQSDCALPGEKELAEYLSVSRPTMREAVRILADRGVLNVVHGRGTFVVSSERWTDIPTVLSWQARTQDVVKISENLIELRRMVEVGSTGLAARRADSTHIARMRRFLDDFDISHVAGDVDGVVAADLEFHNEILRAAGNPFLRLVLEPLAEVLHSSRHKTSSLASIRVRAQGHHRRILAAIEAGDEAAAKQAMRDHMTQTWEDNCKVHAFEL